MLIWKTVKEVIILELRGSYSNLMKILDLGSNFIQNNNLLTNKLFL